MRILIVTHFFPPEVGAPQARLSELARLWAMAGHEVTVLTGMPNHPTGVVPPAYRGKLRVHEAVDGYRIVRTWLYATPNEGFVKRTIGHLTFMLSSVALGARPSGEADVVMVSSPTFFSMLSAWLLARLKRAPLVVEVRDLWPALLVELGVLQSRLIIRALEAIELRVYAAAALVVVVTQGFKADLVRRGVPAEKVHAIPNGVDLDAFRPDTPAGPQIRARGSDTEVLVLYAGAHGLSQGLMVLVEAADRLRESPVHLALVGEGATKEALAARARELGLTNLSMHPAVPREEMPGLLASADICVLTLRDIPIFNTFIPSKIFEYLAAGKPVIGAVSGEAAEILHAAGALTVPPEDSAQLAKAIDDLARDPARRERMGRRARPHVEEHYDRSVLASRYAQLLRSVTLA